MTSFANQLKSEIARIAKKEARGDTQQHPPLIKYPYLFHTR
jgi:hypothetical protein